jgi:hypothetical protein
LKERAVTNPVPVIRRNLRLVLEDGDLGRVSHVDQSNETARIKVDGGGSYNIGLNHLRRALVDGDYAVAEDDEEEDVEDEEEEPDMGEDEAE